MTPGLRWHPLPPFPHLPALMISPHFTSSSYTLYITDLANMWVETLDRKGILFRSLQENTSIDLSDGDPKQWTVFFSKLNTAFDPPLLEDHGTSLSISGFSSDSRDKGSFALHVTCVLPEGLPPLKWPIYLTKCPPAGISTQLVLPLIQKNHVRALEVQDLITRLKDKDAIITKLIGKLEANQIGLEHVFNSLSGKRKPSRAIADEKVKGLALFNENDWISSVAVNRHLPQDAPSLIREAFTKTELQCRLDTELSPSDQVNDWWTKLGSHAITAIKPHIELPKRSQDSPSQCAKMTHEKDDDDFQVQTLPPDLQSRRRKLAFSKSTNDIADNDDNPIELTDSHPVTAPQDRAHLQIGTLGGKSKAINHSSLSQSSHTIPADDDETASESDTESVQPRPQTQPNSRLGNTGNSRELSSSLTKSPSAKLSSPLPPPKDDDETASDSDSRDSDGGLPVARSSSPAPAPAARKNVGLGRIGGKSKSRITPEPLGEPNMSTLEAGSPQIVSSPAKSVGRKIGTIGRKPSEDGKRQRSGSPSTATVVEPETEEQRTGRRRAELAKELERKATAPTKKKRRF